MTYASKMAASYKSITGLMCDHDFFQLVYEFKLDNRWSPIAVQWATEHLMSIFGALIQITCTYM